MSTATEENLNIASVFGAVELLKRNMTIEQAQGLRVLQLTEGINSDTDKVWLMSLERVVEILEHPLA